MVRAMEKVNLEKLLLFYRALAPEIVGELRLLGFPGDEQGHRSR
jgi:hypothetical protein